MSLLVSFIWVSGRGGAGGELRGETGGLGELGDWENWEIRGIGDFWMED